MLAEADRACAAAGAKLLVVYVPDKFRVYQGLVEFAPDAAPRTWTVNDLPARVRALVERLDPPVEFFDLTSALRASTSSGRPPLFTDDTHWSAEGHIVAAAATAELIVRLFSGR